MTGVLISVSSGPRYPRTDLLGCFFFSSSLQFLCFFLTLLAKPDPTLNGDPPKKKKNVLFFRHVACGEHGVSFSAERDGTLNDHESDNEHSSNHTSEKTKNRLATWSGIASGLTLWLAKKKSHHNSKRIAAILRNLMQL